MITLLLIIILHLKRKIYDLATVRDIKVEMIKFTGHKGKFTNYALQSSENISFLFMENSVFLYFSECTMRNDWPIIATFLDKLYLLTYSME